jgi:hypothetical protein
MRGIMTSNRLFLLLAVSMILCLPGQAATIFTLNPSDGVVAGQAGQTVGWGFEISDSTNWVVVAASGFCVAFDSSTDTLPCQAPTTQPVGNGTYLDYFGDGPFNFIDSAPGSPDTSQENFDATAQTGIGAFTIDDDSALIGHVLTGVIVVKFNEYNSDPLNGGNEIAGPCGELDCYAVADASVDVTPEPATVGLFALGLGLAAIVRRRAA